MISNQNKTINLIILLIVLAVLWHLYNSFYRKKNGDIFSSKLIDVPYDIKCPVEYDRCEEGDIDAWDLIRGLIFLVIGIAIPNKYLVVIIMSILFELIQPYFGGVPKYIINPLINITGYAVGSIMSPLVTGQNKMFKEKYKILVQSRT